MHYKDHLGERLRLREKVEEDRSFANLERMRREGGPPAKALSGHAMAQAPDEGACPRCGIRLMPAQIRALEVHQCDRCGGIWLDRMALRPFPSQHPRPLLDYVAEYFRAH
ncbi:MAG: TFIIB-type zinc ribbon-containing protein [Algiphilus sp.]